MRTLAATLAVTLAVAGCKDEKKEAAPGVVPLDSVRSAALQAVAALPAMPKTVQFRGVQVYPQAAPHRTAVCGLVSAFADDPNIFVPFVIIANQVSPPDARTPRFEFDPRVGTTTAEATRVYGALVADCWDRGGPAAERPLSLPPLPDNIADPRTSASDPAPSRATTVPGQVSTGGTVSVRQSANVHAGPGGPSIRTVAQGATLHIFSQAPGGWYQVGDTAPYGWVHESMLNK